MTKLYGIKNCDSVIKAKRWLEGHDIDFQFHDFRIDGLTEEQLSGWAQKIDYAELLNKRSQTWKKLTETEREDMNQEKALALMVQYPTLVKRPVLETKKGLLVGFAENDYVKLV